MKMQVTIKIKSFSGTSVVLLAGKQASVLKWLKPWWSWRAAGSRCDGGGELVWAEQTDVSGAVTQLSHAVRFPDAVTRALGWLSGKSRITNIENCSSYSASATLPSNCGEHSQLVTFTHEREAPQKERWTHTGPLTLSTMKSIAFAILGSTGPLAKFPKTIFFSKKAGMSQKLGSDRGQAWDNSKPTKETVWADFSENRWASPVRCPRLVKDGGVAERITQDQRVDSGRLVGALCKLLSQEPAQGSAEQVDLRETRVLIRQSQDILPCRQQWAAIPK